MKYSKSNCYKCKIYAKKRAKLKLIDNCLICWEKVMNLKNIHSISFWHDFGFNNSVRKRYTQINNSVRKHLAVIEKIFKKVHSIDLKSSDIIG